MKKSLKVKRIIQKNYSLVHNFIIFGSPARKSNSRIFTGNTFILGKSAQRYTNIFNKQIKHIKEYASIYPITNGDCLWYFELYYNDKRADTSIELIFDLMEKNGIVKNDVLIRNYIVSSCIDRVVPRAEIFIYKPKGA